MSALMVVVAMLAQAPRTQVEVTLFPAAVQLNGKFTQTGGTFGAVSLRVRDGVSLQVFGGGNWLARNSSFNDELVDKMNLTARVSTRVAWTWATLAGLELEPLSGTLSVFGAEVKFGLTLGAGLGGGGATVRVMTLSNGRDFYGDAGARFMATVSSGLRVTIGRHFVLRAEIRDVMFSSRLSTINGCSALDVYAGSRSFDSSSTACGAFSSRTDAQYFSTAALGLLSSNTDELVVNIGAYVGAGVVF